MPNKLTSFEEFKDYREKLAGDHKADEIEVRVAMATCAIATGAKSTYEVIADAIDHQGLDNVKLKQTGCMGYCFAEPTVEIIRPGQEKVVYGPVDTELAQRIVLKDIMAGERIDGILKVNHENA